MKIIYEIRITNKGSKNTEDKKSIWNSVFHLITYIVKEAITLALVILLLNFILKFHGWDIAHWLNSLIFP